MTELKLVVPEVGEKNTVADPRTQQALEAIRTFVNTEQITSGNIKEKGIEASRLSEALQESIAARITGLTYKSSNVSVNAVAGEFIQVPEGTAVTLPASVAGAQIGMFVGGGGTGGYATLATSGGAKIYGDFVSGATSVRLAEFQHVTVLGAGGTTWLIIAGEPKREQVYSAQVSRAPATEFEASPTRPVFVTLEIFNEKETPIQTQINVGTQEIGRLGIAANSRSSMGFYLLPGQKWKTDSSPSTVKSSYLEL